MSTSKRIKLSNKVVEVDTKKSEPNDQVIRYYFYLLDKDGRVLASEEFTEMQVDDPFQAFDDWVKEMRVTNPGAVTAKLVTDYLDSPISFLLKEVKIQSYLNIKRYDQIEFCTADELISSDWDYWELFNKYEVDVVSEDSEHSYIFFNRREYGLLIVVHCATAARLLQVLSLGGKHLNINIRPGLGDYIEDDFLPTYTFESELDRQVYLTWFMASIEELD